VDKHLPNEGVSWQSEGRIAKDFIVSEGDIVECSENQGTNN
jgi:hypothetical protein